jgi:hypothetical protein
MRKRKKRQSHDLEVVDVPSRRGQPGRVVFSPRGSYDSSELLYRDVLRLVHDLLRLLKRKKPEELHDTDDR